MFDDAPRTPSAGLARAATVSGCVEAQQLVQRIFLKDGRLRPILRVLVYVPATLLAIFLLFGFIYALLQGLGFRIPGFDRPPSAFKDQVLGELVTTIAIVGVALLLRAYLDRRSIASLGFAFRKGWLRLLVLGAVFGAGMQCLVFAVQESLGYSHVVAFASARSDAIEFLEYLPFFIIAALSEEMSMRGYIFQNLWEEWGAPAGIVVTAALFAALHLNNPNSHANLYWTIAGLAAFGVWACLSFIWTRSLWLALGAHFAWNLFEGPVLGFPVSGISFGTTAISQRIGGPVWFTGGPFGPESGAVSLIALAVGLAVIYWLYRRGAFDSVYEAREPYARPKA